MPVKNVESWICIFVIFLTAFFAFFFKKNYPEIVRSQYIHAAMTVRSIEAVSEYCCVPECACDDLDALMLPSCQSLKVFAESLSPTVCANAGNSSLCPPVGAAAGCDYGRNYQSCGSYGCEYSSCFGTKINHQLCQLECDVCYRVAYTLTFPDRHGRRWIVSFSRDLGYSILDVNAFMAANPVNSTVMAYYNPSNPGTVIFKIRFHPRKWGLLVLFGFPLFVATAVITQYLIAACLRAWRPAWLKIDWLLNLALWIGLIWPFVVLLPILKVGYVEPNGKKALSVLIPTMAAFGWLPLALYRLVKVGWSVIASVMLSFSLFVVPLGVVLPCMLVLVHSTTTATCLGILVGACLLLFANFLIASWKQILAFRVHL